MIRFGQSLWSMMNKLAVSDHFNLVIVYTKGYPEGLDRVIQEITVGLTHPVTAFTFDSEEMQNLKEKLEQWEDEETGIIDRLKNEVSQDTYLRLRSKCQANADGLLGMPEGQSLLGILKACPKHIEIPPKKLAVWLLADKQQQLKNQFSTEDFGNVQIGRSGEVNWIRTDKLFITVLSKQCSPEQLEGKLANAIKESFPSPHRLLLTKMRAEIDQRGLLAEAAILGNSHIQAVWLNDFLNPNPIDTKATIRNTVNRHWEALGDELSRTIEEYSEKLREYFSPIGIDEAMKRCGLNSADIKSDESLKQYNCFSSTKQIDRSHLTTGHILQVNSSTGGEPSFWICLSPACDMVPGQKGYSGLSDCIPFVAVKLDKVLTKTAVANATDNIYLFLEIGGNVESFSLYKEGNAAGKLEWEQKFVRNKGRFHGENAISLGSIVEDGGGLGAIWNEAHVVAQLRAEYALNLLQRVGALLSRPGLGMNFKAR